MSVQIWPAFNACLNATSAVLLLIAYWAIRQRRIQFHRALMISAFGVSTVFLISYLIYHSQVGSVRYQGAGFMRTVYFLILISHSLLAVVIVPLILRTFFLAWKNQWESHRRIARWTLPLWMYVSVTGVVIYGMLYGIQ